MIEDRKLKSKLVYLIILNLVVSMMSISIYIFQQKLIDHFYWDSQTELLFFGISIVFYIILKLFKIYNDEKIFTDIRIHFQKKITRNYVTHKFNNNQAIEIDTLVGHYSDEIIDKYYKGWQRLISYLIITFVVYVYAFYMSWIIGVYSIIFMIICYFINNYIGKEISPFVRENSIAVNKFISVSRNFLDNYRVIKQFLVEKRIINKLNAEGEKYNFQLLKTNNLYSKLFTISSIVYFFQKIGIIIIGAILFFYEKISPGEFLVFIFISSLLSSPLINIGNSIHEIKSLKSTIDDYKLYLKPFENNLKGTIKIKEELINVYIDDIILNEKLLLMNANIDIKKGEKILLLGKNGSGKSLVFNRIVNLFLNSDLKYNITINNHLSNLIDGSIEENIIFNNINDNISVIELLSVVNLDKDKSYNIDLTRKNFSGGEKQKIIMARNLFEDKEYIFLDEPFSSIDEISCDKLINEILFCDKTVFLISHKVKKESVLRFDKVLLINENKVIIGNSQYEKGLMYETYIKEN